jgi:hypothetical protein
MWDGNDNYEQRKSCHCEMCKFHDRDAKRPDNISRYTQAVDFMTSRTICMVQNLGFGSEDGRQSNLSPTIGRDSVVSWRHDL